jgi:hypothetical protein
VRLARSLSILSHLAAGAALLGCSPPVAVEPPPAAPTTPPPVAAEPPPPAAPLPPATILLDGGCDEAKVAYLKECQDKPSACADRSAGTISYGSILNEGAFLSVCRSPQSTAVKVCAAIRGGHAVAVTVTTTPGDKLLSTCIGKAVEAMDFPPSPRLDVASTVFAAQ